MRVKTSITLPKELLDRLERLDKNRSTSQKQIRDGKDIAIIDRAAKRFNREATETLEYQQLP